MQYFLAALSAILSYIWFYKTTVPGTKINKKIPTIKFKRIQLLPSVKITIRGKVIHLHHWFDFSLLLIISIFVNNTILDSSITRGFLLGGIVQGLRFPDRHIIKSIDK